MRRDQWLFFNAPRLAEPLMVDLLTVVSALTQDALALGNWQGVPKGTGVGTHHARQVARPTLYADCKESVSVAIKMEVARAVQEAAKAASPGPNTTWEELAPHLPDRAEVTA